MEAKDDALYALVRGELEAALDPAELRRRGTDALHELAIDAAAFAAQRLPGEIRVRVGNPGGHRAGRTIVEVLLADQPFIVDSVRLTLRRLGRRELLVLHPLLALEREADGTIARLGRDAVGATRESYVYAELRQLVHDEERSALEHELERALGDARCVVADHAPMLAQLREHAANLEACAGALPGGPERVRDLTAIYKWLEAKNFLFLGYRRYDARRGRRGWEVELEPASGLGLLRGATDSRFAEAGAEPAAPPALVGTRLDDERVIFFDKTRSDSTVHRRGRLDSVSVKLLDRDARPIGFGRFVGLFTHRAIRMRPSDIPILAARRTRIVASLGAEPGSHTHKTALEAYDCLPVEFLFPADAADVGARGVADRRRGRAAQARGHHRRRSDQPLVLRQRRAAAAALRGADPRGDRPAARDPPRRAPHRPPQLVPRRRSRARPLLLRQRGRARPAAARRSSTPRSPRSSSAGRTASRPRSSSTSRATARCAWPTPTPTRSPSRTGSPRRRPRRCSTCATSSACTRARRRSSSGSTSPPSTATRAPTG